MPLVKIELFVNLDDLRRALYVARATQVSPAVIIPDKGKRKQHILKHDKVHVLPGAKNPFKPGTIQHREGERVLKNGGKTVAACRRGKDGASRWVLRELVKRNVIKIDHARAGRP